MVNIKYVNKVNASDIIKNKVDILSVKSMVNKIIDNKKTWVISKSQSKEIEREYSESNKCQSEVIHNIKYVTPESWAIYMSTKWYKACTYLFDITFNYLSVDCSCVLTIDISDCSNSISMEQEIIQEFSSIDNLLVIVRNEDDIQNRYQYVKAQIETLSITSGLKVVTIGDAVLEIYIPKTSSCEEILICVVRILYKELDQSDIHISINSKAQENLILNTLLPKFDSIDNLEVTVEQDYIER